MRPSRLATGQGREGSKSAPNVRSPALVRARGVQKPPTSIAHVPDENAARAPKDTSVLPAATFGQRHRDFPSM